MRVVTEAFDELLEVLVDEGVIRDVVHPLVELGLRRQLAVQQEVCDLRKGGVLGQLLDGIAAVFEDSLVTVDVGDSAAAGGRVDKPRIVGSQPWIAFDRDLFEIGSTDRPVCDRDLVLAARTVIANAQGIRGGINHGRIRHAHNLRAVCEAE